MSFSFVKRLDNAIKIMPKSELITRVSVLSAILIGHGIYAITTVKDDMITVVKKYKMNRNGFTDFMIIDNNGRHFNVNNSLWYWKWDSIEDWYKIEEKTNINIKYYGWRWPVCGLFPNIVKSKQG